jgi:hypothetical protein
MVVIVALAGNSSFLQRSFLVDQIGREANRFLRFFAAPMGVALRGGIDLLMSSGYSNIRS